MCTSISRHFGAKLEKICHQNIENTSDDVGLDR